MAPGSGTATPRRGRPAEPSRRSPPSLAEHVCLVLVTQGVSHGWAIGTELAPDGELGRIWTLSRPLTYRAVDRLVERGLLVRHGATAGGGRDRIVLDATAAGRRVASAWLDQPVAHVRDIRTELLIKLALRQRADLDVAPLIAAQADVLVPAIESLTTGRDDDLVALWRRENARAARRFLSAALDVHEAAARERRPEMRLSARNQLRATVDEVTHGEVMATVKVTLPDGQHLTAAITKDAAVDLDIARGDDVTVIVKSTEVMLATSA